MPKKHPWVEREIKHNVFPAHMYRDPALNAKLRGDRCEGCAFEKAKYDNWDKSVYYVCLQGRAYGSRCVNYKKGAL